LRAGRTYALRLLCLASTHSVRTVCPKKRKSPVFLENTGLFAGPSEKIRTSGLLNPIQARYQLRYTRIS
jgi:hypothetical protein